MAQGFFTYTPARDFFQISAIKINTAHFSNRRVRARFACPESDDTAPGPPIKDFLCIFGISAHFSQFTCR